jgi:hypothetical protein
MKYLILILVAQIASTSSFANDKSVALKPGQSTILCAPQGELNSTLLRNAFVVEADRGPVIVVKQPYEVSAPAYSERGVVCVTVTKK